MTASSEQSVRFTVPLVPPSVNTYVRHSAGRHYKTSKAKSFEDAVGLFARGKRCPGERFFVKIAVYLGPNEHPDCDNLPKLVLDGCAAAGVFNGKSDNHVQSVLVTKYDTDRENPRTEIEVSAI